MDEGYEFWKRVDALRGKERLDSIAEAMEVKPQSVKNMRSNNKMPRLPMIRKLAEHLGTTPAYLIGEQDNPTPDQYDFPEVEFVRKSPEARALVRAIMQDETLLQALSAVVLSMERQQVQPGKTS